MVCSRCGECCKFISFSIPKDREGELPKDYKNYFKYHNVEVIDKEDIIEFRVWNRCENLDENNLCKIWETRPEVCRNTKDRKGVIHPEDCTDKPIEVVERPKQISSLNGGNKKWQLHTL